MVKHIASTSVPPHALLKKKTLLQRSEPEAEGLFFPCSKQHMRDLLSFHFHQRELQGASALDVSLSICKQDRCVVVVVLEQLRNRHAA